MKKLFTVSAIVAILVASFVAPLAAQEPDGSAAALTTQQGDSGVYIVMMVELPVVAYEGDIQGMEATKPGKGGKINPNSAHVRKYAEHLEEQHNQTLNAVGAGQQKIYSYTYAANGFAAMLTFEQAAEIAKQPGVASVRPDELRYLQTDNSPTFLGLTDAGGAWLKGYTGEDVVVGVIDSGIWPEHPSFADDGSYAPLPITLEDTPENPACNFGNTAHNANDVPFACNNKLLGARQMLSTYRSIIGAAANEYDSARDDGGHGTHTASTAAGNAGVETSIFGIPRGTVSGIAPRARIIAYKGLGILGGFGSDLAAAIDQAVADGVDVINYSVGGGASLSGPDDIAYLFAADAGVFVATSAGKLRPQSRNHWRAGIGTVAYKRRCQFAWTSLYQRHLVKRSGHTADRSVGRFRHNRDRQLQSGGCRGHRRYDRRYVRHVPQ